MPGYALANEKIELPIKKPGDRVRYVPREEPRNIEDDWQLVRLEPTSGNTILERGRTRVSVPRTQFDTLNFPGSDAVYFALAKAATQIPSIAPYLEAFVHGDLSTVRRGLITIASHADPSFSSIQTTSDLAEKLRHKENANERSLEILKLEVTRADRDYNRFVARTGLENDKKDSMLTRLRNLEDQFTTRLYEKTNLIPAWRELYAALEAVDAQLART